LAVAQCAVLGDQLPQACEQKFFGSFFQKRTASFLSLFSPLCGQLFGKLFSLE
jgi:hypothetical protein